jgi:sulfite reductase (NADPH) hemoprotein beta-component
MSTATAAPAEKKLTHNEEIKLATPTLAGTVAQTLAAAKEDPSIDRFSEDDTQFMKFHGIYQQDDRDLRKTGKKYMFMIRGRIPGGVLTPDGYLTYDRLATTYGNNTLRITTRQSFQFHGVVMKGLGPLMKQINEAMMDTVAACGDVNRNVLAPPAPPTDIYTKLLHEDARRVSEALKPRTAAYHSIWVEGVQLNLEDPKNKDFEDPLYGKTYLPRKFKTAFAIAPVNDVDILTNCLGFVAIPGTDGKITGYNVLAGGGMGRSHGNVQTYPRLADTVAFAKPDQIIDVARAVLTVHRDFGDRTDRKHARLKYVLEEKGVAWFRTEVEQRLGYKLEDPRPVQFTSQKDRLGWHKTTDGTWFLGLFVMSGRIKDDGDYRLKTALRTVVEKYRPEVRLTPTQNILLCDISEAQKDEITKVLAEHGVPVENQATILRRASMACPALPTCGLSLAESERYIPALLDRIEAALAELGLADEEITIRMTGCPNGCARPYAAEIGFVGKAPGRYQLWLGGNESSTRINRIYKDVVKDADMITELKPLFQRWKETRLGAERFGDWAARVIWPEIAAAAAAAAPAPTAPTSAVAAVA